jgi:hypothetical protein
LNSENETARPAENQGAPQNPIDLPTVFALLRHVNSLFALHLAIRALAAGAWCFWTFAAWRSRIETKLENLKAADEQ